MKHIWYLLAIFLSFVIASNIDVVHCFYIDQEQASSNTFTALTPQLWKQTTRADFVSGVQWQVDTEGSSDDVQIALDVKVYALEGNGLPAFWRYNVPAINWSTMTNTPNNVKGGGALAFAGGNYIYALYGNNGKAFWRYNISANTWSTMTNTPGNCLDGASLAYAGGNYIYALQGNSQNAFWRYNISANTWSRMTNTPGAVAAGGALAYAGGNYLYALQGNSQNAFWRYNISTDSWTTMNNTPDNIDAGGALACVNLSRYVETGSIASQVLDTGPAGTCWNALFWNSITPDGTSITLQVRATDTAFNKEDSGPFWITLGGTSPVMTGLPSGRYKQWRVNLTTSIATVTPVLQEVRVWYY